MPQAPVESKHNSRQPLDETRQRVFLQSNGVFDHVLEVFSRPLAP